VQAGVCEAERGVWPAARRIIAEGRLGRPLRCYVTVGARERLPATDLFHPLLAALHSVLDEARPFRVSAAGGAMGGAGRTAPDSMVMTCTYPDGCTVTLVSTTRAQGVRPPVIHAERGSVKLLDSALRVTEGDRTYLIQTEPAGDPLDGLRACRACQCTPEAARGASVAVAAAIKALRTARAVECTNG